MGKQMGRSITAQSERKTRARLDGRERDAGRAERCARPCDGDATARRAGGGESNEQQ